MFPRMERRSVVLSAKSPAEPHKCNPTYHPTDATLPLSSSSKHSDQLKIIIARVLECFDYNSREELERSGRD